MMYAIYDQSGRIVRSVDYPEDKADRLAKDGLMYIQTPYTDETHYVENGAPVPYPEKPGDNYRFDYEAKAWVPIKTEQELQAEALANLRRQRNALLGASDWTQLPDAQVDKQAWADYRQALRDLPENLTDTGDVVWPEPPVL